MEILHYEFMRNALVAALLASVACGVIGSYVVAKRLVFVSGGISHSTFGGIGLGFFLGINPMITLIPFALLCAIGIGLIHRQTKLPADTAIGIFWTFGMALGIIFINLTPGYVPDLFSYLFGNILTVPTADLTIMIVLDAVIIVTVRALYKEFLAISFDEEYAEVSGLPVGLLNLVLLCLIALTVVLLIRIVGLILVIALLTIPAAIAKPYIRSFAAMILVSIIIGIFLTVCGLFISYRLNLASGATIILFSCAAFTISSISGWFWKRFRVRKA